MSARVPARFVDSIWDGEGEQPGSVCWYVADGSPLPGGRAGLIVRCPCGCGDLFAVSLWAAPGSAEPQWSWDRNEEQPTLSPSILRLTRCGWHGWLRLGVFTTAGG